MRTGASAASATSTSTRRRTRTEETRRIGGIVYHTAMNFEELKRAAGALGVKLDADQLEKIALFRVLLEEGNKRAALTTRTDEADYLAIHVLDSLTLARALAGEATAPRTLLDVGSGA